MNLKKKLIDTPIPQKPSELENRPAPGRSTFPEIAFSTVTATFDNYPEPGIIPALISISCRAFVGG